MSNNCNLSPRDRKFLDSYDISMFKSAVAYLQNSRHNSCQPGKIAEPRSPFQSKFKHLKEIEPPLLPIESRLAALCKKYVSGGKGLHKVMRQELKQRFVENDEGRYANVYALEIKGQGRNGISQEFEQDGIGKIRQGRRNSVDVVNEEENKARIFTIHHKILDYERNRVRFSEKHKENREDSNDEIKTSEVSLQTCDNFDDI